MTLVEALKNMRAREDWGVIVGHVRIELDTAMMDFQSPDQLDNPQKLARLAGEIAALDRLIRVFSHAEED
jgi:hypothetical protein